MGIEPTRGRVNDPSTALKAAGPTRYPDTPHVSLRMYHRGQMNQLLTGMAEFFSSRVSIDNEKKCRAVGAEAQISKPRLDQLVHLIDEVIERNPEAVRAPTPA